MARRRNSIAKRFTKMRGLPPEEKALMLRIGNLIDAALNNRQASNPFEESTFRLNRQVYPPTGLLAQGGIASVKLVWNPANSNEHLRYEIEFLNLTTGESTTKSSYTNFIVFKGDVGTYIAKVSSVGRDGSKSSLIQVEFDMGNDVMLIEGAKNQSTELGTVIQDNMKLYKGFSVYVWGSVVLDKQVLDTNRDVVFRLFRAEVPDAVFNVTPMTLEQTITLYPASETGSNLDTTAKAGLISRPIAATRPGSFETSQSVMFSPIAVADRDDEKTVTYFLQAVNRETEQDEVALSLTMWAGMDGVGSAVPGDSFEPRTPYVFPNLNSFHNQTPGDPLNFPFDHRSAHAVINDGFSLIGNEWTIAIWVRFDDLDAQHMSQVETVDPENTGNLSTKHVLTRGSIRADNDSTINSIRINVSGVDASPAVPRWKHKISIAVGGFTPGEAVTTTYQASALGDRQQISALFPYNDAIGASNSLHDTTNNGWVFMVICFGGGDFTDTLNPKIRLYLNMGTDPLTGLANIPPTMERAISTLDGSTAPIVQNDVGTLGYQFAQHGASFVAGRYWATPSAPPFYTGDLAQVQTKNMSYNQIGIWNVALDSDVTGTGWNIGPIDVLYNGGFGTAIDWKQNAGTATGVFQFLNYVQSENLVHLIQFGAVEKAFDSRETLRDTGYFLPGGELNFTTDVRENAYFENWHRTIHDLVGGIDRFHQIQIPFSSGPWFNNLGHSWTRGADIYDILSPTGSNNTTQYDWAHPGQNL